MSNSISVGRAWKPAVGVLTAATAIVASWAPIARALPTSGTSETGLKVQAADAPGGTFESCAAYFGFGKNDYGVIDVVQFDVADQNGSDGIAHSVPADTQVVLVLTNEDGETLECTPPEITQSEWDDAMDSVYLDSDVLPAWPGPGRYAYPSVAFNPHIEDFGRVVDVGFEVTSIPTGHTLVSPTGVKPLVQHYPIGADDTSDIVDPRVLGVIESSAGTAASDAFGAALPVCDADEEPPPFTSDLVAAVNALNNYLDEHVQDPDDMSCNDILSLNPRASTLAGLQATITYSEPIVLSLPEPSTTSSTTTTTMPVAPSTTTAPAVDHAAAAAPVAATPTYAG